MTMVFRTKAEKRAAAIDPHVSDSCRAEKSPIVAVEIRVQHGDFSRRDTASQDVLEAETETFLVTPHGGSSVPFDWVPYGPRWLRPQPDQASKSTRNLGAIQ